MSATSPSPTTDVDFIAAFERVTGKRHRPSPPDRRSSRDIERDERLIDREQARRDDDIYPTRP